MSGLPMREALGTDTLRTVAAHTRFGEICSVRIALLIGLAAVMPLLGSVRHGGAATRAALALALLCVACLAGTGHAAMSEPRLAADAFHVVAAAAWIGALPPFARAMSESIRDADAASYIASRDAAHRFSVLGIACVATLIVSGIVNATYSLPALSALYASPYGRLLAAKLVLFAVMLALASVNRLRHSAGIVPHARDAVQGSLRALRRNALVEFALGLAIVAIVAQLGITMPPAPPAAMHMHLE
jgi:putative copper resistance protein D